MNELSLFTGAGGGLLGTHHLLGFNCIGYVEWDDYCQRVIAARIRDGYIPAAPIFGDIRAFISEGYAKIYQGMVDVVSGGFPCQAFSTAARGRTNEDRDFWPEMLEVIRIVQPTHVFAENVSDAAMSRARRDLEAAGYQVRRAQISAAAVGAIHYRRREWLHAYTNSNSESHVAEHAEVESVCSIPRVDSWGSDCSRDMGMDDGLPNRMDRLRAIGNAQLPIVARRAWELLS